MTHSRYKHSGFTLIEVLIALFISAIVMAVATQTLRTLQMHAVHLEKRQQSLSRLSLNYLILQNDITHIRMFNIANSDGATILGTENSLTFNRAIPALANNHIVTSQLEVSYALRNNSLIRTLRDPHGQTMLQTLFQKDDIRNLRFSYFVNQKPQDSLRIGGNDASKTVIQLDFDSISLGHIQWLFAAPDYEPNLPTSTNEANPNGDPDSADNNDPDHPASPSGSEHPNGEAPPDGKTPAKKIESDPDDTI